MKRYLLACITCAVLLLGAPLLNADVFFGEDLGLGETTRLTSLPNANAAKASFLADLTGIGTEDFESIAPLTSSPVDLTFLGSGVTGVLTSGLGAVLYTPGVEANNGRYPISGTNMWDTPTSFTVTFSAPVTAFGFYGVDLGDTGGQLVLKLINGGESTYTVGNSTDAPGGSVVYWGITNPDTPFHTVEFSTTNGEYAAYDDMTVGFAPDGDPPPPPDPEVVPEPATTLLVGAGLFGLMMVVRKRNNAA